jgi:hypothetical protein
VKPRVQSAQAAVVARVREIDHRGGAA